MDDIQIVINNFKEFKLSAILGAIDSGDITEEQIEEVEADLLRLANWADCANKKLINKIPNAEAKG